VVTGHPVQDVGKCRHRVKDVRAFVQHHAFGADSHGRVGDFGP